MSVCIQRYRWNTALHRGDKNPSGRSLQGRFCAGVYYTYNVGEIAAPTATVWITTHYGWQAAILATAGSAVIGIIAWLAVKPDVPLKIKSNNSLKKVA